MPNGYKAFYNGKTTEVWAETSHKAQVKAAEFWKVTPKNRYKITVMLCEKDGEQIVHRPVD